MGRLTPLQKEGIPLPKVGRLIPLQKEGIPLPKVGRLTPLQKGGLPAPVRGIPLLEADENPPVAVRVLLPPGYRPAQLALKAL